MIRVLVVDDNPSVGAAIRMTLDRNGCETVHALDAFIGMRILETSSFDLTIVDIFMPGMDGLKAIAEFRKRVPTMPILAISGFRFRDSMDPGLDFLAMASGAGAAASLRKPFAPRQLMAAVHATLDAAAPIPAVPAQGDHDKEGCDDVRGL